MAKEITAEEYEQMLEDLENGKFIPIANGGVPQTVFPPYYCSWYDYLDCDQVAQDAISEQYLEFIHGEKEIVG